MKALHISGLFLALNIILFILIAAHSADQSFEKITVKEFELVTNDGKRRASIKVEPSGEVVLRLMDGSGDIRVKIGANQDGSGLVLLDDSTEPAIHALAKKEGGKLTIQEHDGKKRDL